STPGARSAARMSCCPRMPTPIAAKRRRSLGAVRREPGEACARRMVGAAAVPATVFRNSRRERRTVMLSSLQNERQPNGLAAELRRSICCEADLHRLLRVEHARGCLAILEDARDELVDLRLKRVVHHIGRFRHVTG